MGALTERVIRRVGNGVAPSVCCGLWLHWPLQAEARNAARKGHQSQFVLCTRRLLWKVPPVVVPAQRAGLFGTGSGGGLGRFASTGGS